MRHNFYLVLYILLDVYPFLFMRYAPFKGKYIIPFRYIITILSLLAVLQATGFIWLNNQPWVNDGNAMLYRQAWVVIFFILSFCFIKDSFCKLAYVWLLVMSYSYIIIGMGKFLSEFIISAEEPLRIDIIVRLIQLALTYPFAYAFMSKTVKRITDYDNVSLWRCLWVIPLIFNLMGSLMIIDVKKGLEVNLIFVAVRYLIAAGSFYTTFIFLKLMKTVDAKRDAQEAVRIAQTRLAAEQEQYELIRKHIEETRVQRHDFKHHVAVISSLAEQGETQKLKDYVAQYNKTVSMDMPEVFCKSFVLNSLLCYYKKFADDDGTRCEIKLAIPERISIPDNDLCIIFGNLFENAIEACRYLPREKRYIMLKATVIGSMLSVLVENSFDGEIKQVGDGYLSRKRGMEKQGVGILSVKTLTEQYGGTLCETDNGEVFSVNLLLPYYNINDTESIRKEETATI